MGEKFVIHLTGLLKSVKILSLQKYSQLFFSLLYEKEEYFFV